MSAAAEHPSDARRPTIAAIATAPGTGAIALLRLTGPDAVAIADRASGGKANGLASHTARYCHVKNAAGEVLDDGILTVFKSPNSFTGEDCVEFTGHGGILVSREVLGRFLECGAVPAGPGE